MDGHCGAIFAFRRVLWYDATTSQHLLRYTDDGMLEYLDLSRERVQLAQEENSKVSPNLL